MSERVYAAQVELEMRRRETLVMADVVLDSLRDWAKTGERFELDLSGVMPDTQIPVGSLAHWLDEGEYCNALARVSTEPAELLSLMLAYQQEG